VWVCVCVGMCVRMCRGSGLDDLLSNDYHNVENYREARLRHGLMHARHSLDLSSNTAVVRSDTSVCRAATVSRRAAAAVSVPAALRKIRRAALSGPRVAR